jgi:hypothetical protein
MYFFRHVHVARAYSLVQANSLKKIVLQSASELDGEMEYSEDLLWHGHEKQMGYSMICPEMVRCYSLVKTEKRILDLPSSRTSFSRS